MSTAFFSDAAPIPGNTVTTSVDWVAPTVGATVIAPTASPSVAGYVRQGGTYYVYANVTDGGGTPSGVQSVTANVSAITAGQTSTPLSSGSFTVAGTTYGYRSAQLTAGNPLAAGSKAYSLTALDNNGNSATQTAFSVTVDNAAPSIPSATIAVEGASTAGYVKNSATYRVYANPTDSGGAGLDTVLADASNLTTGQTSVTLTSNLGPWTVGGTSYTYRSSTLTANSSMAEGTRTFTVTASDNAVNSSGAVSFSVTVDNAAPTVSSSAIAPASGAAASGFIKQGGSYYIYANASDTGTGVATVTANVSNVTAGQTAVALSSSGGPFTIGGTSFTYRSAALTAGNPLSAGAKTYTVTAADFAGNNTPATSFSVTVDNTAPTVSSVQIALNSGTVTGLYLRQGSSFYVYANVSDAGGAGLSSVTADISSVAAGQTAAVLSAGSYTFNGTSYGFRSALLTTNASIGAGTYSWAVTATDNASNSTATSNSVTLSGTYYFKNTTTLTGTNCATGTVKRDMELGAATGSEQSKNRAASDSTALVFCTDTFDATAWIPSGTWTVDFWADNSSSVTPPNCTITATVYVNGSTTVGSGTATVNNGSSKAERTISFSTSSRQTFSAGDRLNVVFTWQAGRTACDSTNIYYNGSSSHSNLQVPAAADATLPVVSASTIERSADGGTGYLAQGAGYRVYANATDAGGSDLATVAADVSNITSLQTSVTLSSSGGPWTVSGTSYVYRSSILTAGSPLSEGTKAYSVTASDNAGNIGTTSYSVVVDNTAPTVSGSIIERTVGGGAGYLKQATTYYVYANTTDSSGIASVVANVSNVTTGQTSVALTTTGGPWTVGGTSYAYRSTSVTANSVIAEGAKSYTVTSTDNAANSATATFNVTIDNTGPVVTAALAPTTGAATAGYIKQNSTFYVYANATDTSGVATVTATVASVATVGTAQTLSAAGGPWTVGGTSYAYRSAALTSQVTLANGSYSFTSSGTDVLGTSSTTTFSVTVDNTSPSVSATTLQKASGGTAGFVRQSNGYYVYANASDATAGIFSVTANVSTITTGQTAAAMSSAGGPWTIGGTSYAYRTSLLTSDSGLTEGTKSYSVTATDNAAVTGTTSASATADNTAPTIAAIALQKTAGGTASFVSQGGTYYVYANASDASAGLASLSANVAALTTGQTAVVLASAGGPWTVAGTSYSYRSAQITADNPLAAGSKTYSVTVADNADNSSTSSAAVTVDNTAPQIGTSTVAETAGGLSGAIRPGFDFRVYANASDAPAGVDTVTANVSTFASGQTALSLSSAGGPWAVGGTTYTYRSAAVTSSNVPNGTYSYTVSATDNASNSTSTSLSVVVDSGIPQIDRSVITHSNGTVGFVRQGGQYYVYAFVESAAQVSSVSADLTSITAGQTAPLSVGSWTIGGQSYNFRSALLTADGTLSESAKGYTVTSVGNGFTVVHVYTTNVDNTAPSVNGAVIQKESGAPAGYVAQGASYRVYANATDGGAGLASVIANVGNITSGATSIPLSSSGGPWTIGGTSYSYRSAAQSVDNPLSDGSRSFSVTAIDNVDNQSTSAGLTVVIDNVAPSLGASIIQRTAGGTAGYIGQGSSYYVYANASDGSSGVSALTADVSTVTTGQSATALSSSGGPWTVGGTSYSYRSASLTANASLAEGPKNYTVNATDGAANSVSASFSVTVDNSPPTISASVVQSVAGGTAGFVKQGISYYVYANASDSASGIASVTANVANITTGQTAVGLTTSGGPWTVSGTSYTYRSTALTANAVLSEGSKTYTATALDNSDATQTGTFSVTVDNSAPTFVRVAMASSTSYGSGYVRSGGAYYVYAQVSDTSGVASITANVVNVTAGASSVALSAGSYSTGGLAYNYRSAALTAAGGLAEGSKSYSVSATDGLGTSGTTTASVTVDNTAPTLNNISSTNKNLGTSGQMEQGDKFTFEFSEAIDPELVLSGWTGASTNVVVRFTAGTNTVTVYDSANTTLLPLGSWSLGANYASTSVTFGATGSASTMAVSTTNIVITLGTASGATNTVSSSGNTTWTSATGPTDIAGNGLVQGTVTCQRNPNF